jgi:hypothetical protein
MNAADSFVDIQTSRGVSVDPPSINPGSEPSGSVTRDLEDGTIASALPTHRAAEGARQKYAVAKQVSQAQMAKVRARQLKYAA